MRNHVLTLAAALLLRERAHWRLRQTHGDAKAHAAADVLLYDAAVSAALEAAFDAAVSRIAAPIVPPVPEKAVPETGDLVVDELRREFPEWCTHRHTWMHIVMYRDDRASILLCEGSDAWYVEHLGEAFASAVDAAEHATGLVRLSRRDALDGRR